MAEMRTATVGVEIAHLDPRALADVVRVLARVAEEVSTSLLDAATSLDLIADEHDDKAETPEPEYEPCARCRREYRARTGALCAELRLCATCHAPDGVTPLT